MLASSNCSVTLFAVWPNGRVGLLSYNDTGHLPAGLITSVYGPLRRLKR